MSDWPIIKLSVVSHNIIDEYNIWSYYIYHILYINVLYLHILYKLYLYISSLFIQRFEWYEKKLIISKSLFVQVARVNYEKYGNPDGPGTMKIGIGLPHFLVAKEYQLFILLFFFSILLVVIPGIFVFYYRRQKKYARKYWKTSII